MPGPPPKPTVLKLASGNPGGKKIDDREPVPPVPSSCPDPPAHIAGDPEAVKVWRENARMLWRMGLLTEADIAEFARLCELEGMRRVCRRKIAELGTEYPILGKPAKPGDPAPVKYIQEYPHAVQYRRLSDMVMKMGDRFGLTPASRTRIRADQEQTTDPLSEARRRLLGRGA